MALWVTAAAACHAIAISAAVISIGVASRRFRVISTIKELSALQATFLEPALAFSALSSLTAADFATGAPLLLWAPVHAVIALGIAYLLLPSSSRRGALLLCSGFGNAGALPNAIVPVMLPASAVSRGLLFVQVYMVPWRFLLWSIGPALLRPAQDKKNDDESKVNGAASRPSLRQLLLPPPSIGSFLGLVLACAPSVVRGLFFNGGPLAFVIAAAQQAGAASPPVALIGLGFALSGGERERGGSGANGKESASNNFSKRELAVCLLTRLLFTPALHLVLFFALSAPIAHEHNRQQSSARGVLADPLTLVLLLQAGMPSAASVQALFQRSGADTAPLGSLLAWQYMLAAPAIVLHTVIASKVLS